MLVEPLAECAAQISLRSVVDWRLYQWPHAPHNGLAKPNRRVRDMRIALVTTFFPPYNFGGDGIYVQRLAKSLAARGHDIEVIHDTDGYRVLSDNDPEPETHVQREGITIHRLRSRAPKLAALAVQQTGRPILHKARLKKLLASRFDVIHYHNISLVGGPGVWEIGSAIKLHTAHEHWMVCPTHVLWRYNRELCDARHCLKCALSYRRPPQLWRQTGLIDRMAPHVDAFLTFSQSTADNHRRFGFRHPIEIVPSFLPEETGERNCRLRKELGGFVRVWALQGTRLLI